MSIDINTVLSSSNFQLIDGESSAHVLPGDTTPVNFRASMLCLQTKTSAHGIYFYLEYDLNVNGPPVNLTFDDDISDMFQRHHFDGFGSVEYASSDPINKTTQIILVTESDGRIETFPYNTTSEEIIPVCSSPFTSYSFMAVETDKSKKNQTRPLSIQIKVYVFPKSLRDHLISRPLLLPTRKFSIADGYAYPLN